ncbi:hypothetical protein IWX81_002584 [Salinibacterium sp. CAN_S4]|uniref:hypothetical protein n=1 Tax=Salinibacterium sp. CAN_S4 TaxID=2787727 RepID=UPI0018EFA785
MPLQNEKYAIGLCDEVLAVASAKHHRFSWLMGDESPVTGRRRALPVDAYWESLNLVMEFHEKQHTEAVALFDNRKTLSGMNRGSLRKLYDNRRIELIPQHRLQLVTIPMSDFIVKRALTVPSRDTDVATVRRYVEAFA